MLNPANLPDDIDALKTMLAASLAALADRDAVIERKEDRIGRLEKLLTDFKRAVFGHRSERPDPEQYELALEDIETAIAAIHAEDQAVDPPKSDPVKPRHANRGSLPKHLPRDLAKLERIPPPKPRRDQPSHRLLCNRLPGNGCTASNCRGSASRRGTSTDRSRKSRSASPS